MSYEVVTVSYGKRTKVYYIPLKFISSIFEVQYFLCNCRFFPKKELMFTG